MQKIKTVIAYGVLVATLVALAAPFFWMVSASFKEQTEIFRSPPTIIPEELTFKNYVNIFGKYDFVHYFFNSVRVAVIQTLSQLFLCSLAGFAFAKYEFRLKNSLFLVLLSSMMVPPHTTFVPLFQLAIKLRLIDTYIGIVLPGLVGAFGIFFMRQNMETIPSELLDAARIDGASEFSTFWRIAIPLTGPALSVLAVLSFLSSWNAYVWPLIIIRTREMQTLPVMLAGLVGLYRMEHGILMAGAFLSAVPVVILFAALQRYFVQGITVGALRG